MGITPEHSDARLCAAQQPDAMTQIKSPANAGLFEIRVKGSLIPKCVRTGIPTRSREDQIASSSQEFDCIPIRYDKAKKSTL